MSNLSKLELAGASIYEIAFYKQNASFTLISSSGYQYLVTIADWDILQSIFNNRYNGKESEFNASYNALANLYKKNYPGASEAEATEYALKGKLGDSIHLYKKRTDSDEVDPLELEAVQNPSIPQKIQIKNCP